MKTILVPTDFSKNAENALQYAINLANKMEAKIILLHSFHIDYTNAYVPVDIIEKEVREIQETSNGHLKALYKKVSHHSKHPIECISSQNLLLDEILRIVEEKNISLIVMGTKGAHEKLSRQVFGTNSSRVIEKAKCPVIIVPEDTQHHEIKNIVYATEYIDSDISCLKALADIAKLFEASIQIIHVSLYHEDEAQRKLMEDFKIKLQKNISYANISYKILIGTNIEQRIGGYMEEEAKVDLLVMSAHHRNLVDKLFGKSITRIIGLYLKTPLMVFHHERTKLDDASDQTIAKLIL